MDEKEYANLFWKASMPPEPFPNQIAFTVYKNKNIYILEQIPNNLKLVFEHENIITKPEISIIKPKYADKIIF